METRPRPVTLTISKTPSMPPVSERYDCDRSCPKHVVRSTGTVRPETLGSSQWQSTYLCDCPGMTVDGTVTCVIVQRRTYSAPESTVSRLTVSVKAKRISRKKPGARSQRLSRSRRCQPLLPDTPLHAIVVEFEIVVLAGRETQQLGPQVSKPWCALPRRPHGSPYSLAKDTMETAARDHRAKIHITSGCSPDSC